MPITIEAIHEQIPYYLSQEAKKNLINALNAFPKSINYYIDQYHGEILQGDCWTLVEVIRFEDGSRKLVKGVLLSNSCDIAPENKRELPPLLTFSPIIRLSRYLERLSEAGLDERQISNKAAAIKEQKVTTIFYLPKGGSLDDDYIALLNDVHTVPYPAFDARKEKNKLFTLSQVGFYIFLFKLSIHFCRFHEEIVRDSA